MTIHRTFSGAQYVAGITDLALDHDIALQVGHDFGEYADLVGRFRKEQPLGDPFNPEKQPINSENGFWVVGWNPDGEVVYTQAMRHFRIRESLAGYMNAHYLDFPPPGAAIDLDRSRYTPGPAARRMQGSMCYHGDAWLKGGPGGYRGTGLAGPLARFAMATAMLRWLPDYIFGFMLIGHAFRGLAEREGYMHTEPGALYWHLLNNPKVYHAYMVWMSNEDMRFMMDLPLEALAA